MSLKDDTVEIKLYNIPNPHADGMIIAHVVGAEPGVGHRPDLAARADRPQRPTPSRWAMPCARPTSPDRPSSAVTAPPPSRPTSPRRWRRTNAANIATAVSGDQPAAAALSNYKRRDSRRAAPRSHLDLDLHARIGQAGLDHRGGGPDVAQILLQHRPTGLEVLAPGQDVAHAHDVDERRTGLRQRGRDVAHRLSALDDDVVGHRHRRVVEAGGAGHEESNRRRRRRVNSRCPPRSWSRMRRASAP